MIIIVMGVSGSGKTAVGRELARQLGCPFYDGDEFHPPENIAKMARGLPLDDHDREPWLARLRELMGEHAKKGETAVFACSALKKSYRDLLRAGGDPMQFVHLQGDFELIWDRMRRRKTHYMKADMLESQFDALEPPGSDEAMIVDITQNVADITSAILDQLGQMRPGTDQLLSTGTRGEE